VQPSTQSIELVGGRLAAQGAPPRAAWETPSARARPSAGCAGRRGWILLGAEAAERRCWRIARVRCHPARAVGRGVPRARSRDRAIMTAHEEIVREQLEKHVGQEIKTIGDSFMVAFEATSLFLWAELCADPHRTCRDFLTNKRQLSFGGKERVRHRRLEVTRGCGQRRAGSTFPATSPWEITNQLLCH